MTRSRRITLTLITVSIVCSLLGVLFGLAAFLAFLVSNPIKTRICCETPVKFNASYETITIKTADGLQLSGWYIPPAEDKSGPGPAKIIILVHSYYADRRQTLPVAKLLYQNGYGLLMLDQRASGESEGNARSLGWLDIPDVLAASNWIATRSSDAQIGIYGCSMGAAIALAGSVGVPAIRAIAADAPSELGWVENLPGFSWNDPLSLPIMALYYPLVMLRAGALPSGNTSDAIHNLGSRAILFISSGQPGENQRVSSFYSHAAGPKEYLLLSDATHCGGPISDPELYQQRLVNFFNSSLR